MLPPPVRSRLRLPPLPWVLGALFSTWKYHLAGVPPCARGPGGLRGQEGRNASVHGEGPAGGTWARGTEKRFAPRVARPEAPRRHRDVAKSDSHKPGWGLAPGGITVSRGEYWQLPPRAGHCAGSFLIVTRGPHSTLSTEAQGAGQFARPRSLRAAALECQPGGPQRGYWPQASASVSLRHKTVGQVLLNKAEQPGKIAAKPEKWTKMPTRNTKLQTEQQTKPCPGLPPRRPAPEKPELGLPRPLCRALGGQSAWRLLACSLVLSRPVHSQRKNQTWPLPHRSPDHTCGPRSFVSLMPRAPSVSHSVSPPPPRACPMVEFPSRLNKQNINQTA